jgi:hypothetical protein
MFSQPQTQSSSWTESLSSCLATLLSLGIFFAIILWLYSEGCIKSKYDTPSYQIPKFPEYKIPKITVPDYKIPKITIPDNIFLSPAEKKRGDSLRKKVDSLFRNLEEERRADSLRREINSLLRSIDKEKLLEILSATDSILTDSTAIDNLFFRDTVKRQEISSATDSILKTDSAAIDSLSRPAPVKRYENDTIKITDTIQR